MKGFTTKRTSAMPILPLLCVTRSTSAFTWFPLQDESPQDESPTPPDLPDIVVLIEEDAPRPTAEPAEIEVDSVEEGVSFRCPLPTAIGCTAPDPLASDECSEVGTLCPTRIEFGEHCCLDECGRTFCTAKPAKRAAITAVDDYTFTRDGASVRFNVLFNDFTIDYSTNLNFGVELALTQVMPGFNGFCDVESPGVLSYTPDPVFDGSDYCVYTVCESTDLTNCDTATLEIAVTTTDAITLDFLSPDRPLIEVDNAAILSDRHPVSDIYPEGTSPYETVGGAESFMTDELWTELLDEIGLSSKNGEANYGLHVQAPSCEDGEELLSIELQGDEYGDDITWELRREYNTGQNATVEVSKGPYGKHPYEYLDLCVPNPSIKVWLQQHSPDQRRLRPVAGHVRPGQAVPPRAQQAPRVLAQVPRQAVPGPRVVAEPRGRLGTVGDRAPRRLRQRRDRARAERRARGEPGEEPGTRGGLRAAVRPGPDRGEVDRPGGRVAVAGERAPHPGALAGEQVHGVRRGREGLAGGQVPRSGLQIRQGRQLQHGVVQRDGRRELARADAERH
ncbi:hypothetical protein THAOC_10208 [Thalassiosira oceanica]|uniref:Uncharacterized protein n=1 Tax=Thalassiosira oceanica TaxID=159749 RepID=K0SQN4_THAOC|nr:hypothetical protein THAOC_10208 [Thalassiosira oceanica]|eukprot:EJK68598.1 hypothetical protein THAOC_10208 [Thalassiosira oceanica]